MREEPGWTPWPCREPSEDQWKQDLTFARRVQAALLEASAVIIPGVAAVGCSVPFYGIGGDYFDLLPLPDGRLRVFIADVMGKGFGAALVATMLRGAVRAASRHCPSPGALLYQINDLVYRDLQDLGSFITASCVDFHPDTGRLSVACAGHPSPLLLRRDADVPQPVNARGVALGMLANRVYLHTEETVRPGDLLVMYTDGILEAKNYARKDLGAGGLQRLFTAGRALAGTDLMRAMLVGVGTYTEGEGARDDVTLVTLQFEG